MEFHGKGCHGGLQHQFPWNSMEISPSIFSLEDYDIFHGISWKSSMQLHLAETIEPRTISILSNQTRVCVHVKLTFSYTARSGWVKQSILKHAKCKQPHKWIFCVEKNIFFGCIDYKDNSFVHYCCTAQKSDWRFEPRKLIFHTFLLVREPHVFA